MSQVRFLQDDVWGSWKEGDLAEYLGRESDNSPIHQIRMKNGQTISLTSPFSRGIVERANPPRPAQ